MNKTWAKSVYHCGWPASDEHSDGDDDDEAAVILTVMVALCSLCMENARVPPSDCRRPLLLRLLLPNQWPKTIFPAVHCQR